MLPAPSPTPMMISIAIVSSIAILMLDTYRGRNFRYRPALVKGRDGNAKDIQHKPESLCRCYANYTLWVLTVILKDRRGT